MSTENEEAAAGPTRLAAALMENGSLTSDWLPAYEAAPRYKFLPDTIWPGVADGVRQGEAVNRMTDSDAWWRAVHSDIPLTTQWDGGEHDGDQRGTMPTSSNSMPTMVFSMLDALALQPGHRVQEIGTGTGWSSALMSARVGSGNVVTIEVDEHTASAAVARLHEAGFDPMVVVGDGARGSDLLAPYDRVIATCSVGDLPYAWVEQSTEGGVIVAPWGPEYGGEAIVRLTVHGDGTASGPFLGSSAFMRLRQQRVQRPGSLEYLGGQPWPAEGECSRTPLSPESVSGWLAMFAIGVQLPGVFPLVERYEDGSYTLWVHDTAVTSWATVDWEPDQEDYEVVQSGPRRLWDQLSTAYEWWMGSRRPGFERFGLTVTADGQSAWLDRPGNTVPSLGPV
ncbi:protein-L-isoaspartate(D-aspartate) O-methyltransferase [Kitasatospora sp. NBC_00070]|uniref:protein-L-isoaspartate(D-aspartate) O-methyltransferase n=1 Tax=Kitasatospora sp. NBC_00070 TaxID=2975962 RepID=UPI00324FCDB3